MPSTYSPNLAVELIATGEQAGTWGTVTNTNLGTLLEQAISGYVTQAVADGNTTITIPNGATGVARNMFLELTGALSTTTTLTVPANKKLYFIFNNTTGGIPVTVLVSGQTGVSVPALAKVVLVCDGTDIVEANNYHSTVTLGTDLAVADGGTGRSTGTTAYALVAVGTTATGAQQTLASGATTEVLVGGGASALPVWTTATGTGAPVRATSATLVTPALGTPSALVGTNITGTAAGLTAGNVTTNANLTGDVTSIGNTATIADNVTVTNWALGTPASMVGTNITGTAAGLTAGVASAVAVGGITGLGTNVDTFLATPSSANLASALTDETGSGLAVFDTSPTLVTPTLTNPAHTSQALSWTSGGTTSWDTNSGDVATVTATTGNTTFGAPTNLKNGGNYVLKFTQDPSVARTITWNAVFKWDAGAAPVLSTTLSAVDILSFWSDGTNMYGGLFVRGAA